MSSKLERAMYSPLHESTEEDTTGWDKETVRYAIDHAHSIRTKLRSMAKSFRKTSLHSTDVDDLYQEFMSYLYRTSDYDINKAMSGSSEGIISIEGYISTCAKFTVMRACSEAGAVSSMEVSDTIIGEDGKEVSLFNSIPDKNVNIEDVLDDYDLDTICRSCEPLRYRFGPDLYQVLYIGVLTMGDKTGKVYDNMLNILGIRKKDLKYFDTSDEESPIGALAKAITNSSYEETISVLERYVYSAHSIKAAIATQLV